MYKTWFQRQKSNSPYKASAMLIQGARDMGRGVPLADSAAELHPESQAQTQPQQYTFGNNEVEEGDNTDAVALKSLQEQLNKETDVAKKQTLQEQITKLEAKIAKKIK